jgi:hypothetical protein
MKKLAHELNREISKEEIKMGIKYTKKYSTSLIIKKMQNKTTLRFHLIPVIIVKFKDNNNNKCW